MNAKFRKLAYFTIKIWTCEKPILIVIYHMCMMSCLYYELLKDRFHVYKHIYGCVCVCVSPES